MQVENWSIEKVIPYARNPRKNDEAVDAVVSSIKEFGFRQPIVVDREGVIVCGHTRFKAARRLGLKEVPVHVAADLTPAQAKAYRIADNRIAEIAEWDEELLGLELAELQGEELDLSLLGFDDEELKRCLGDLPAQEDWESAAGKIPTGPGSGFQQMTFTLTDGQTQKVKEAIGRAKGAGPFFDTGNENSNGNALARIAEAYRG